MSASIEEILIDSLMKGVNYLRREKKIQLVRETKEHIESITHPDIKGFILEQLNEKATSYRDLFCRNSTKPGRNFIHDPHKTNKRPFPIYSPLALFYLHAPAAVSQELTRRLFCLDKDSLVSLLSVQSTAAINNGSAVIRWATRQDKLIFVRFMNTLSAQELHNILAEQSSTGQVFDDLRHLSPDYLIDLRDDEAGVAFFTLLGHLTNRNILSLFKTKLGSSGHMPCITLLNKPLPDNSAFALLNSLQTLDMASLRKLFFGLGSSTLLHPVLRHYSDRVAVIAINLLLRFPEKEIKTLLTRQDITDDENDSITLLFRRPGNSQAAFILYQGLESSVSLSSLLITTRRGESPMHLAVKNNHLDVVTRYLEQWTLRITEKPLLESLAEQARHTDLIRLFQASPVYDAICRPEPGVLLSDVQSLLQDNPGLVQTRWSQQQTLLHKAAIHGRSDIASCLTGAGACLNALDANGLTPLHYAVMGNSTDLQDRLIQHGETNLILALQQALALADYPMLALIQAFRRHLPDDRIIQSLARVLADLPRTAPYCGDGDAEILNHSKVEQSRYALLLCYGKAQSNARNASILECANLCAEFRDPDLINSARRFVQDQLSTVQDHIHTPRMRGIKNDLFLFLFAMPVPDMLSLIKTLQLDDNQRVQLDLFLINALLKPVIYSRLSLDEHRLVYRFLSASALSASHLVSRHFLESKLHLLPLELLRDFANESTLDDLLVFNKAHKAPALLILTLEKALINEASPLELFEQLTTELELFNRDESTLSDAELRQMFNLIETPQIKARVIDYLSTRPFGAPIHQRLAQLFLALDEQSPFTPNGLLHDLFLNNACHTPVNPEFGNALTIFVSMAEPDDIHRVLAARRRQLKPLLFAHAMSSENTELAIWLQGLEQGSDDVTPTGAAQAEPVLEILNRSFSIGVLANPSRNELLPSLTEWQIQQGHLCSSSILMTHLVQILPEIPATTRAEINQQQTRVLDQVLAVKQLISTLRDLAWKNPEFNAVIEFLLAENPSIMRQLHKLAIKAQCHDLAHVTRYVLTDPDRSESPDVSNEYMGNWLHNKLDCLEGYASSAVSLKGLVEGLYLDTDTCYSQLQNLNATLETYPFPLSVEAISHIAQSWQNVLAQGAQSLAAQSFMLTFSDLFQNNSIISHEHIIQSFPPCFINLILEHCLSGVSSDEQARVRACRHILSTLCQHSGYGNGDTLALIKHRLGQHDTELLGNGNLHAIAQSVLSGSDNDMMDATYDGVWIQRLLISPRFVAEASPTVLHALIERYRAISLTLKQDQFTHLTEWLAGKSGFSQELDAGMKRWQQAFLANPEKKARLAKKQANLLGFRADDSIRALLNRLEDECLKLSGEAGGFLISDPAMDVLYAYHSEHMTGMRADVLFRMANFVYARFMRDKGDVALSESTLLNMLAHYWPHNSFHQDDLVRKTRVDLYDHSGKKIAFLNESNYAIQFKQGEIIPLLAVEGMHVGTELYNSERRLMGTLTASGQLKHENLFQHQTSALLVAKVPTDKLEQCQAALSLLFQDIFNENSLEILLEHSESQEKKAWVQNQVMTRLEESGKPVARELIDTIIATQDIASLIGSLGRCINLQNTRRILSAILADDIKRDALFDPVNLRACLSTLSSDKATQLLADTLIHHHDKIWFHQSLALFGQYARASRQKDLLSKALLLVSDQVRSHSIEKTDFDRIMAVFVCQEQVAQIVLQDFLQDNNQVSVQEARSNHVDNLTLLFSKRHITGAIEQLNAQASWQNKAQYRLLLTLFNAQHKRLFASKELRLSKSGAWQAEELRQLSHFLTRHRQESGNQDRSGTISNRLLSELVFRCANFGQTDLFYTREGALNTDMVATLLKRSLMTALAARFYLGKEAEDAIKSAFSSVKAWFGCTESETDRIKKTLKKNKAIIDWKRLARDSWAHADGTQLPLISAYLINYSGSAEPLLRLIKDIMSVPDFSRNRQHWHHISHIMTSHPHRDVSLAIFNALEDKAKRQPEVIDQTIFMDMARFHSGNQSAHAGKLLVHHFGQQKHYALTRHCCHLLLSETNSRTVRTQLKKISTEAKVEASLQGHIGRWYFGILKTIRRWWHYSSKGKHVLSGQVTLCDSTETCDAVKHVPATIKTGVLDGQSITARLQSHQKGIKHQQTVARVTEKMKRLDVIINRWQDSAEPLPFPLDALGEWGMFSPEDSAIKGEDSKAPCLSSVKNI